MYLSCTKVIFERRKMVETLLGNKNIRPLPPGDFLLPMRQWTKLWMGPWQIGISKLPMRQWTDHFPKRKLRLSRICDFLLILPKYFYFWHIFVNMVNVCYSPISWPGKAKVCPDSLITHFADKDVSIWYISVKKLLMISSGRKGWASSNKKAGHPLKHRSGRREDDLFFSFSYFCAARIKPNLR